eukprot:TRINITY_DN23073_c0_g1_i1.p1 TRINITY_DN23073_c0_g1~~TRINITY_DN23073_c0_g1_i1.p1  ORF type:complete len:336 (+),score=37.07 TRINITY_DN23073_c0_g1_i1:50-1009(+)
MAMPGVIPLHDLLADDTRLSEAERAFLLQFFQHLGLVTVSDLRDIDCFEPVSNYLRTELQAYQQQQIERGTVHEGAGAVRAALGRLLRNLEASAPGSAPVQKGHALPRPAHSPRGRQQRQPQQLTPRSVAPSWGNGPSSPSGDSCAAKRGSSPPISTAPAPPQPAERSTAKGRRPSPRREGYTQETVSSASGSWAPSLGSNTASTPQLGSFARAGSRQAGGRQTYWSVQQANLESSPTGGIHHYRSSIMDPDNRRPVSPRATIGNARRDIAVYIGGRAESPGPIASPREDLRRGPTMPNADRFAYNSRNRSSWVSTDGK